jgi:two-component system sensor histidine kinase TctE
LLEQSPEKFRGKIATYDIGVSGVGYLFATTESMLSPISGDLRMQSAS